MQRQNVKQSLPTGFCSSRCLKVPIGKGNGVNHCDRKRAQDTISGPKGKIIFVYLRVLQLNVKES